MGCFRTAEANAKQYLRDKGLIDDYLNILDLPKFRAEVTSLSKWGNQTYGITGRLFTDNGFVAIPNKELFQVIDFKKGVKYPENEWVEKSVKNTFTGDPNIQGFYESTFIPPNEHVVYKLKVIKALESTNVREPNLETQKFQGFLNDVEKQGVPQSQISLLKDSVDRLVEAGQKVTKQNLITDLISSISFVVEIQTSIGNEKPVFRNEYGELEEEEIIEEMPSQYYSNLTVPGGSNYTENEIRTPNITPGITGHAQFSTSQGIGWFRSDDKTLDELKGNWIKSKSELPNEFIYSGERYFKQDGEWQTKNKFIEDIETVIWRYNMSLGNERIQNKPDAKTRRILEVQSDWGQKQRKSAEPDINIKYDIQQIINDLQKSGDLKIDCN